MNEQQWARRMATWLPRLAEPADMQAAGAALFEIEISGICQVGEAHGFKDVTDEEVQRVYARAVGLVADDLNRLVPAWIQRLLESITSQRHNQQASQEAVRADMDIPEMDMPGILAAGQLVKVLTAVGERLDPYLDPILAAVGTQGREGDERLCEVLQHAGPRVQEAVPAMLAVLREHGVWCWPSHLGQALARASHWDKRVLRELRSLLSSEDQHIRRSAIDILGLLGDRAKSAVDQLLAFRHGSEEERCGIIGTLAQQSEPPPAVLDLLEAAMRDESGYVRRAAAYALGKLQAAPDRFVPLLAEACDYPEYLHDTSLPEAAVRTLGEYGPAARVALPRLRLFLEGPIKGRTVDSSVVRQAIERILLAGPGGSIAVLEPEAKFEPLRRAESLTLDEPLFAVRHQGRQCYIDHQGQLAITTRFSWGKPFGDGRAIVGDDEGTFVINRSGEVVFESTWDDIKPFSEGLAAVQKHEKWGFVDQDGRIVIGPQYDSVTFFSEGLAGVELGRQEDTSGNVITCAHPGRFGFINRSGQIVIPANLIQASAFHGGRAAVCTGGVMKPNLLLEGREVLSNREYGYINSMGRLVIEGVYDMASPFCEGLASVTLGEVCGRSRAGYIDVNGNVVVPLTLTSANDFKDGLALVRRRGRKWRGRQLVIDRTGQVVLEPQYTMIEPFSEGLAAACSGAEWGFIDTHGKVVIEPQFDQCEPFTNGLAEVQRGNWYGLIDRTGRFVWGPTTEGGVSRVLESEWT